jgi:hypothetical protein
VCGRWHASAHTYAQEAFLFDWPRLPLPEFAVRLAGVWGAMFVGLGLPISLVTFSMDDELLQVTKQSVHCLWVHIFCLQRFLCLRVCLGRQGVDVR